MLVDFFRSDFSSVVQMERDFKLYQACSRFSL